MENLNIYKIRDLALSTERRVFSIKDIANLINRPYSQAKVYSNRLVEKKLAKKVYEGRISFTDNEYIEATQIIEPSYLSMTSSFFHYGLIKQVPSKFEIVSTKITWFKSGNKYYKLTPNLFFGYKKELAEGSYYFVAEPEKAIIDFVYFKGFSESLFEDFINKLNKQKIKEYLKKYDNLKGYRAKRVLLLRDYVAKQKRNKKPN